MINCVIWKVAICRHSCAAVRVFRNGETRVAPFVTSRAARPSHVLGHITARKPMTGFLSDSWALILNCYSLQPTLMGN